MPEFDRDNLVAQRVIGESMDVFLKTPPQAFSYLMAGWKDRLSSFIENAPEIAKENGVSQFNLGVIWALTRVLADPQEICEKGLEAGRILLEGEKENALREDM